MELRRHGHRWTLSHDNFDFVTVSKTKTTVHGHQAWKACIFQASALKRCIIGETGGRNATIKCICTIFNLLIMELNINYFCFDGSTSIFYSISETINRFSVSWGSDPIAGREAETPVICSDGRNASQNGRHQQCPRFIGHLIGPSPAPTSFPAFINAISAKSM